MPDNWTIWSGSSPTATSTSEPPHGRPHRRVPPTTGRGRRGRGSTDTVTQANGDEEDGREEHHISQANASQDHGDAPLALGQDLVPQREVALLAYRATARWHP
ncbi:hypothetical protein ACQ4WX_22220 [Streptomyces lasalocidi]